MQFEWDRKKEKTNIRKHGINFSIAASVFGDEYRIEKYDDENSAKHGEDRYLTIRLVGKRLVVISVAYTMRDSEDGEITRIISAARPADAGEKEEYWNAHGAV